MAIASGALFGAGAPPSPRAVTQAALAGAAVPVSAGVAEADGTLFVPGTTYPGWSNLAAPVVGWTARPGAGDWEVASDGGVFSRQAPFYGSLGGIRLAQPIVGMAPTPTGQGYWLVASDGGIFAFGDAGFHGSTGGIRLAQPIVGMAPTPTGQGYWLVASDGGIFTFGDAGFYGSVAGRGAAPAVGVAPSGAGYDVTLADGSIWQFAPGVPAQDAYQLPIPAAYVQASESRQIGERVVATALAQVGKPYITGGAGPVGFDCSGLTMFAYASVGIGLPRTAAEQFAAAPHVPLSEAQPGDILFFYPGITHDGIYIGDGLMVDAPVPGTDVRVEAFSPWFGPVMGVGRPALG